MAYSKEDWAAVMNSEVMRGYLTTELQKQGTVTLASGPVDKTQVLEDFAEFEKKVLASPKMKQAFKAFQDRFKADPEYTAKVDPSFVEGVMLLNLSDEQE